jgi:hypothetical protein
MKFGFMEPPEMKGFHHREHRAHGDGNGNGNGNVRRPVCFHRDAENSKKLG